LAESPPAPGSTRDIPTSSPRSIAGATLAALVVAAVVLVVAILPAEYGIDPIGTGRALGLLDLAGGGAAVVSPQKGEYKTDTVEFVLGPYQTVEYKYRIEQGAGMLYSWQATSRVLYDFHSEPDDAPPGYAESFDKQESERAHGVFTAPFSGVHGWYWENRGSGEISISLTTAGFYSAPREYFDGGEFARELKDSRGRSLSKE
jgi:hypothetical protein